MISMKNSFARKVLWAALLALLVPGYASAQVDAFSAIDEIEISRDAAELQAQIDLRDRDLVDTALVFTNIGLGSARVACRAFDANGDPVGRIRMHVPANGLRFVLASDLSHGQDFVGHVMCRTGRVIGSAVLLAPSAITDLKARPMRRLGSTLFPVVASY
ncbi:MAG: hypothetical protein NZ990_10555 [Myxococcota bacterium]|nr:hypothetical protein [Myxococcota bacterium]